MITTISLMTSIMSYRYKNKEKEKMFFFLVVRTLRIYSLNNFQIRHTVVLIMSYVNYIPSTYLS